MPRRRPVFAATVTAAPPSRRTRTSSRWLSVDATQGYASSASLSWSCCLPPRPSSRAFGHHRELCGLAHQGLQEKEFRDAVLRHRREGQYGLLDPPGHQEGFHHDLQLLITSRYGPLDAWPNVTIPNFQEHTEGILRIAEGRTMSFNPIITQDVNRLQ